MFIKMNFTSEKEFIDPLMSYFKDSKSKQIKLYIVETIKLLSNKAPHLIHELISIFLSFTSITNADINALR